MFLVDTCGWIEWMIDSPLAKSYSRYLTSPDSLIVPRWCSTNYTNGYTGK